MITANIGIHDYWYQYERFWTGLVAARAGRPTLTVGGDIHRSYVAHAPTLSLVEVVASPMSPVFGQALLTTATEGVRRFTARLRDDLGADRYAPGTPLVEVDDLLRGPAGLATARPGGHAVSLACLPRPERDEGGFALLRLDRPDEHLYRLVVQGWMEGANCAARRNRAHALRERRQRTNSTRRVPLSATKILKLIGGCFVL